MSAHDFDLFVIGGGSGGVRAARMAAGRGARVALAETLGTDGLGGTCVNVGCIPKKLYSYAAHYADAFEESHGFGWEGDKPRFNWATLKANRAKEIAASTASTPTCCAARASRSQRLRALDGPARRDRGHAQRRRLARPPVLHGREHPDRHRRHALRAALSGAASTSSPPTRCSTSSPSRSACWWSAAATSPASSRPSSTAWARQVTQLYRGEQVLRGFDDEIRHFVAGEMVKPAWTCA
jgi:glutathione reductase (NADPH)